MSGSLAEGVLGGLAWMIAPCLIDLSESRLWVVAEGACVRGRKYWFCEFSD